MPDRMRTTVGDDACDAAVHSLTLRGASATYHV